MHFTTSASYAPHVSARLRSRDASVVQSLCFLIVSTTRLVYAKSTRNSSCQFSSSRYTAASSPTNSAVLKYTSRSVKWCTGLCFALTAAEISAVVRGRLPERSIAHGLSTSDSRARPGLA